MHQMSSLMGVIPEGRDKHGWRQSLFLHKMCKLSSTMKKLYQGARTSKRGASRIRRIFSLRSIWLGFCEDRAINSAKRAFCSTGWVYSADVPSLTHGPPGAQQKHRSTASLSGEEPDNSLLRFCCAQLTGALKMSQQELFAYLRAKALSVFVLQVMRGRMSLMLNRCYFEDTLRIVSR